jgi:hypothetical protein
MVALGVHRKSNGDNVRITAPQQLSRCGDHEIRAGQDKQ